MTPGGWTWPVARVLEVHDADTAKLDIDLGFSTHQQVWIRLLDVHAPELSEPTGPAARDDTLKWLSDHAPDHRVAVTTYRSAQPVEIRFRNSFTRYIGTITTLDGDSLNQYLIELGYTDMGM